MPAARAARSLDRIRSRETFALLRRDGSRGRGGPLSVTFVPCETWSNPQVAYAIGRRVGGAVVRNQLRRRLRAVMAEAAEDLPPGAYLVSAGPGGVGLRFDELRMAMGRALRAATGRVTGQAAGDRVVGT